MRTKHVVVVGWNPNWKAEFKKIVESLGEEIGNKAVAIEHVGSTSVEGLSSKPCIDIDVVIEDYSHFDEMKSLLAKKGYVHEGDLGIPGREAFAYETETKPELTLHHLYVCPKDSEELKRHKTFIKYLREHPEAVAKYSRVKEEGARLYPYDIDRYLEHKTPFILSIYKKCGLI